VYCCTMSYDAVPGTVFRGPSHDIGAEGLATGANRTCGSHFGLTLVPQDQVNLVGLVRAGQETV